MIVDHIFCSIQLETDIPGFHFQIPDIQHRLTDHKVRLPFIQANILDFGKLQKISQRHLNRMVPDSDRAHSKTTGGIGGGGLWIEIGVEVGLVVSSEIDSTAEVFMDPGFGSKDWKLLEKGLNPHVDKLSGKVQQGRPGIEHIEDKGPSNRASKQTKRTIAHDDLLGTHFKGSLQLRYRTRKHDHGVNTGIQAGIHIGKHQQHLFFLARHRIELIQMQKTG